MTVLETPRLCLQRLTLADAPFICTLLNDPAFIQYIGDRGVRNAVDARAYLQNGPLASYVRYGYGLYRVDRKQDRRPIGVCGLLHRPSLDDADIGYALLPAYWGQGYAVEAAQGVLAHGFDACKLPRIVAVVQPDNTPSVRLLGRLGMAFETPIRLANEDTLLHLYGLTAPEAP